MKTEHTMIDGTRISTTGDGPLVVLVHGVFMDSRMWESQISAISSSYRVCCLDMLGHGGSWDPEGDRSLTDFINQIQTVIEFLSKYGKPVLGGFSMGGLVSQAYAVQYHDNLKGLMLLNTVYDRSESETAAVEKRLEGMLKGGVDNLIESANDRWFTNFDRETKLEAIEEIFGWMRDGVFEAKLKAYPVFARSDRSTVGQLSNISCPVLVMTGENDSGSTPNMARRITESLLDSRLQILEGHRHMMPVLGANKVNSIILDFLGEISK